MDLQERLKVFLERMQAAPACGNAQDALALVCRVMEEVEDDHSPIAREVPPLLGFTGRMYALFLEHLVHFIRPVHEEHVVRAERAIDEKLADPVAVVVLEADRKSVV